MLVRFPDRHGTTRWRLLRKDNIVKVAHSIYAEHDKHPVSHLVGVLEQIFKGGRDAQLECGCAPRRTQIEVYYAAEPRLRPIVDAIQRWAEGEIVLARRTKPREALEGIIRERDRMIAAITRKDVP